MEAARRISLVLSLVGASCGARSGVPGSAGPPDAGGAADHDDGATCALDEDGDGHVSAECGGGDCDDARADVHPGAADPSEWVSEVIDASAAERSEWDESEPRRFAADASGALHVVYRGGRYATNRTGFWVTEDFVDGSQYAVILVVETDGTPHILYDPSEPKVGRRTLEIATRNEDGWVSQEVEGVRRPGDYGAAVGPDGTVHICFFCGRDVCHTAVGPSPADVEVVALGDGTPEHVDCLIDSAGRFHAAWGQWASWTHGNYVTDRSGTWENEAIQVLDSEGTTPVWNWEAEWVLLQI